MPSFQLLLNCSKCHFYEHNKYFILPRFRFFASSRYIEIIPRIKLQIFVGRGYKYFLLTTLLSFSSSKETSNFEPEEHYFPKYPQKQDLKRFNTHTHTHTHIYIYKYIYYSFVSLIIAIANSFSKFVKFCRNLVSKLFR